MKKKGEIVIVKCPPFNNEGTWAKGKIIKTIGIGFLGIHNGKGICARHTVQPLEFRYRKTDPWKTTLPCKPITVIDTGEDELYWTGTDR